MWNLFLIICCCCLNIVIYWEKYGIINRYRYYYKSSRGRDLWLIRWFWNIYGLYFIYTFNQWWLLLILNAICTNQSLLIAFFRAYTYIHPYICHDVGLLCCVVSKLIRAYCLWYNESLQENMLPMFVYFFFPLFLSFFRQFCWLLCFDNVSLNFLFTYTSYLS